MPIRILPQEVVNKIAAGEVVERPSSVVKELVENSLDAGARNIEIEMRGGGLQLIRVSDDGRGMDAGDLRLSVRPHATSKISGYQELLEISSYGFRGEALPSMAAVSALAITSRPEGGGGARLIECRNGEVVAEREAASATGTTVVVEGLFANVPARRKFLRSAATEARRALDEAVQQALANHSVGFKFISDGRTLIDLVPGDPQERWRQVLGDELVQTMVPLQGASGDLAVEGVVSRPYSLWPRRREQHVYVNGRRVSHRAVMSAVYQAYGPALQGRHPAFLLFLAMPARSVDVNVHPAKREVRFREEDRVFRFVRSEVEGALHREAEGPEHARPGDAETNWPLPAHDWEKLSAAEQRSIFDAVSDVQPVGERQPMAPPSPPVVNFWQVHNRYILASIKNGIIMVDQHAAHERILYEELLGRSGRPRSQQLMFPVTVDLSASEMSVFQEYRQVFSDLGFDLREFGGRTIVIEGLPASAAESDSGGIIRRMLDDLDKRPEPGLDHSERVARSFACHGAIKAGQALSQEEMNRLIDRLFATTSPYLDPHGRPAVIKLTLDDLERRFGRV